MLYFLKRLLFCFPLQREARIVHHKVTLVLKCQGQQPFHKFWIFAFWWSTILVWMVTMSGGTTSSGKPWKCTGNSPQNYVREGLHQIWPYQAILWCKSGWTLMWPASRTLSSPCRIESQPLFVPMEGRFSHGRLIQWGYIWGIKCI